VSREDLSHTVLHRRFDALDRSIDNLVSRLRKKFEALDPTCRVLKTVRGEGYVFVGFDHDSD
jgi:DNA-binding response OmpR family regulator